MTDRPTFMDPAKAADVLRGALDPRAPVTVADAAAKSGLALRDAERGLQALSSEYRGQLRVTEDGELVHHFPNGFSKPWETRDAVDRALAAAGRGVMGALRFLTRAWIAIVLVGYALLFVALAIALTVASQSGNDSRRRSSFGGGELVYVLFRVLGDALFWTFHPFSPMYVDPYAPAAMRGRVVRRDEPKVPAYERVNRFFYGPTPAPEDPRALEKAVLAAIRAGKGRIGLGDVMRVTGLPRDRADPMMARLMLDYDGDVDVSEEGGIVYRFPAIRKTAGDAAAREPAPAWERAPQLAPLTGNAFGTNVLIAALNGFNLLMGGWAIANDLTIDNVLAILARGREAVLVPGVPVLLGVIPVAFSLLLFAFPIGRAIARPMKERRAAEERGRLAVLREVLERTRAKRPVDDAAVDAAWQTATGAPPDRTRIARTLTELGGDVAIDDTGATRWRFVDLETEAAAIEAEREAAPEEEARLGKTAFATDEP